MPVACNSNALTGSSGAVYYTPAGTKACLLAADFASAGVITVTSQNDFRVGDPIKFAETGGAKIDSGFDTSKAYVISVVDTSNTPSLSPKLMALPSLWLAMVLTTAATLRCSLILRREFASAGNGPSQ